MSRIQKREQLISGVIDNFADLLEAYDQYRPFARYGQLEFHLDTIRRRRELGSARAALSDSRFLTSLYQTLIAWGIGCRASRICPYDVFSAILSARTSAIAALDGLAINDAQANNISEELWQLIYNLDIVENEAKLVSGSKALHHLLPDLVVPMDRAYTQRFFGWHNPEFQYGQKRCFREALSAFAHIAAKVKTEKFVGNGWNSSRTKVIDNALIGMVCREKHQAV